MESTPLLSQKRLFCSLSGKKDAEAQGRSNPSSANPNRTLGTFPGVFAPVCLSQFSTILFLRVGFVVGSVGLLLGCGTLCIAYSILLLTILSVCAISTNGAVEGGGAYYMISRTLGPEFGGAIGALFFFANVFSSALYSTGCIEGVLENFGLEAGELAIYKILPEGRWFRFLYASILNFINLCICFIGAGMFGKTTIIILCTVILCTFSVIISFLSIHHVIEVPIPSSNEAFYNTTGTYTGLSIDTLKENLYINFTTDYTTHNMVDFATVFSVLFSGITGIMAGANMSGELKNPGRSIPLGTLMASAVTFCTYFVLFLLTAATSSRFLLQNNYNFMKGINIWPPFVAIGVVTATLSASLSKMIGASRILAALIKDKIYGDITRWIGLISIGHNPIGAVIVTSFLVEFVFLIGGLNTIARFTSVLFLLSFMTTNIACLSLEWASAPNFRPTFHFFSWWTAALGIICNGIMMFVISPMYSAICIILCLILVIILHFWSPSEQHKWGSISQALIFHQVRKYLLLLDPRKDHVKFWRPQILLMVADPRSACPLIDFVNDLKKSGLYILGHVKVKDALDEVSVPTARNYQKWQSLVDHLKVKAFIQVTVATSVRYGMQQLAFVSGLGAMKPNTIILGFVDDSPPQDFFLSESSAYYVQLNKKSKLSSDTESSCSDHNQPWYVELRKCAKTTPMDPMEYVAMISDVLNMNKNICLCRHFYSLDKETILRRSNREKKYIDIWPMNFFDPDEQQVFDTSSLFLLQLATILNMVTSWKRRTQLRVFLCMPTSTGNPEKQKEQVRNMLHELRMKATIVSLPWMDTVSVAPQNPEASSSSSSETVYLDTEHINKVNRLIKENSINTAVTFIYLPPPPPSTANYLQYVSGLTTLTNDLPATLLVHGVSSVTTTNL